MLFTTLRELNIFAFRFELKLFFSVFSQFFLFFNCAIPPLFPFLVMTNRARNKHSFEILRNIKININVSNIFIIRRIDRRVEFFSTFIFWNEWRSLTNFKSSKYFNNTVGAPLDYEDIKKKKKKEKHGNEKRPFFWKTFSNFA